MRFSFVLTVTKLLFVSLLFAGEGRGQELDKTISLSIKNAGMKESILVIEKQSGIHFLMRDDLIRGYEKRLNISSPKITVRNALEQVLSNTSLTYVVIDGFVSVINKSAQLQITGKVLDEKTKEALIGVSVKVKGSPIYTITDNQGNFSLKIPSYGITLQFQSLGYQTAEIKVNDSRSVQSVGLKILSNDLREVTVHARRKVNTEAAVLDERRL
ncbi:carboxypeptidase-like regulatory domain-containing protein, partial [Pedobacter sp.]|uniref:carboxypeptidase-like regulatory domain-containing protein n=1 Tax=Pedobacter sp. TaxID=1411316 RepID=UPI002BA6F499